MYQAIRTCILNARLRVYAWASECSVPIRLTVWRVNVYSFTSSCAYVCTYVCMHACMHACAHIGMLGLNTHMCTNIFDNVLFF
jgi:hypothetical protein